MGDYSKLIVACTVKKAVKEKLEAEIEELGLYTSAYQSQELVISLKPTDWGNRKELGLVLVGQTKWGDRQREFCEWLRPHVVQGSGENDVYAMSFSEYSDNPEVWKLGENLESDTESNK